MEISWGVGVLEDQKIKRNVSTSIGISRGVGGLRKIPRFRGGGMDIFWNYTF